jgi:hypothetical protein
MLLCSRLLLVRGCCFVRGWCSLPAPMPFAVSSAFQFLYVTTGNTCGWTSDGSADCLGDQIRCQQKNGWLTAPRTIGIRRERLRLCFSATLREKEQPVIQESENATGRRSSANLAFGLPCPSP